MTCQVRREPTNTDGRRRKSSHEGKEETQILYGLVMVNREEDDESNDTNSDREEQEKESVSEMIRCKGDEHTKNEGNKPDGNGAQLGLNRAMAVFADNRGREVCESVGRDKETEVHDSGSDKLVDVSLTSRKKERCTNLIVGQEHLQVTKPQRRLLLSRLTNIAVETPSDEFLLFRGEPLGILGEIGDQKVPENGDQASSSALCKPR